MRGVSLWVYEGGQSVGVGLRGGSVCESMRGVSLWCGSMRVVSLWVWVYEGGQSVGVGL